MSGDRQTARHEAAHAVACVVLGHELQHVSIVPNADSLGRVRHTPRDGEAASVASSRLDQQPADFATIVIGLAGRAATREDGAGGYGDDMAGAWEVARALTGDHPERAHEAAALVARAWREACRLTDRWEFAIGDVARQLAYAREADGEYATRLIEEAMASQERSYPWLARYVEDWYGFLEATHDARADASPAGDRDGPTGD